MHIIVTGASRGIGYEIVRALAADNAAHKILAIARNIEALELLQKNCKQDFQADINICQLDLAQQDLSPLVQACLDWPQVDIVINNAGYLLNKPFEETTTLEWMQMMQINVVSIAAIVRLLIPKLSQADTSHIVNIGSMGGYQGSAKFPGLAAYSASKGALAILTECLATELAPKNIRANCLCLGAVNTHMLQEAFPGYKAPLESYEMAGFISQFALHQHKFMNGQIIPVALNNPN